MESRRGDLASQLESRLALVHMEALELLGSRASAQLGTKLARLDRSHGAGDDDAENRQSLVSLTAEGGVLERIWQTLQLKDHKEEEDLLETEKSDSTETMSTHKIAFAGAVKVLEAVAPGVAPLKVDYLFKLA